MAGGANASQDADALLGRTLGEFVIRAKLGEGGFGAVYRAEQPVLGREAVVKVLHARHRASEPVIQRFLREAKLASKLDHPFAAHIYAFGAEPDGLLWIAMELVRGTPLDRMLAQKGPLPVEQLTPLLDRLCEVLHSAHEQGIVHRDIKPANVMVLSRAGRLSPKLLDLGIAKAVEETADAPPAELDAFEDTRQAPDFDPHLADTAGTELTQEGAVIGSPHYMAPEQWSNAKIGPATDLYALGVLTYEALTGRKPFDGGSVMAIARAHASGRLPPLGDTFAPAIETVIKRALSRNPADRFASAVEFAAAFRTAAGLSGEAADLPALDEALREQLMAEAPQPLAEAVAQLHTARSVHQAWDALGQIVEVVARYVGVVALAARAQLGPARASDPVALRDRLILLRKRRLSDDEWLGLARLLAHADGDRRAAHPVPELLALFLDAEDDPFEPLLALRQRARGSELEVRNALEKALPALQTALRATLFFCDYALVVPRAGVAERWMGLRLPRRRSTPLAARAAVDHQPLLVNADGAPAVSLWPLAQVAEPVSGSPEELFFVEGAARRGAKLVALPVGFERVDDELWGWFGRSLLELGSDGAAQGGEEEAPYRGLASFSFEDAGAFFGREREIADAVNRLKLQPLLAVVGPSGAGKSSFVHAGVLPALPPTWRTIALRPGFAPLATLAARLAREGAPAADLRADPTALAGQLAALAGDGVVVLVVDQLEELFTLTADADERARFGAALVHAAASIEAPVRVILTLRDDFLVRAEEEPSLRHHLSRALMLLTTPGVADLVRILVEPARRIGYELDDAALAEEMAREVAGRPAALPLLSFTAAKLWDARDRHFKQLTRRAYTAMGGVSGALAKHADALLLSLPVDEQRLVREAFRHLVTSEGTRAVLARRELEQLLGATPAASAVVEKLVSARLLTAQEGDGTDRIEVTHEALLVAWPRLVDWRREDAEGARLRDQLRAAARQWVERGRARGLLWRDDALSELKAWRARHGAALTHDEAAFVDASLADERRGRRRRRALLTTSFVVLGCVALGFAALGERARRAAAEVRARLLDSYEDQGRVALQQGHPDRALLFLSEAFAGGRDNPGLRYLISRARAAFAPQLASFDHGAKVLSADLGAEGRTVLTVGEDNVVRVWDASGRAVRALHPPGPVRKAHITDDGAWVVTLSDDGVTRVWDASGNQRGTLGEGAQSMLLLRRGQKVITVHEEERVLRLWDLATGQLLRTFAGHPGRLAAARPSADEQLLASLGGDARIWDLSTGALLSRFEVIGPPGLFAVSRDGKSLLLASETEARVAEVGGSRAPAIQPGAATQAVALSPDGRVAALAGSDRVIRLWDTRKGTLLAALDERQRSRRLTFTSDGRLLLVAREDGVVGVWDAQHGRLRGSLFVGNQEAALLGGIEGHRALTFSGGSARLWDLDAFALEHVLPEPEGTAYALFAPDGHALFSTSARGALRTWDPASGALRATFVAPGMAAGPGVVAEVAPSGAVMAVVRESPAIRVTLWDPAGGRELRDLAIDRRNGPVRAFSFDRSGRLVAIGQEDGTIALWDVESGMRLRTLAAGGHGLSPGRAFSADGARFVAADGAGQISVWDVRSGALLRAFAGHHGEVFALALSPDGRRLVSAGSDRTALVTWDIDGARPLSTLEGHVGGVRDLCFSADGNLALSGSADGTARVWDVASGTLLETFDVGGDVQSVSFDPTGERAAAATAGDIAVYRLPRAPLDAATLTREVRCRFRLRLDGSRVVVGEPSDGCGPSDKL